MIVRKNATIKVAGEIVKGTFESKKTEEIEALLKAGYITEVKDGTTVKR